MSETERWVEGERVWLKWVQGGPIASARQPVSQDAGWAEVVPAEQLRGAVEALRELVRLKDGPRDDAYRAAKDAAWDMARDVLREAGGR
jgi:hypothetical protein